MYTTTVIGLAAVLALGGTVNASLYDALAARQDNGQEAYLSSVCLPNVTEPVVPPCQEITNIESACLPNGTEPLDLLAHAECMCGGSYFSDWIGCLDCNYVHGGRSPAITSAFHTILTSASNQLCTGTPTASFQAIFSSLNYGGAQNGTDTVTTDLFPSQTAVSLYYTPTGPQGPGQITGSATLATKDLTSSTSATGSGTRTGTQSAVVSNGANGGRSSSVSEGSQSTSSSTAGAAPTGVWMGGLGVVAGVVGMVVL